MAVGIHTAEQFVAANDKSPVIQGSVISHTEGGARYTLDDGTFLVMNCDQCRKLPEGYPKWKGIA